MNFITAFLLAASSNIDNFAVAIAYGIKRIKIGWISNLLIAVFAGLGTFLSMSVGQVISSYLPLSAARFLGSAVLVALGLWSIWDSLRRERRTKNRAHRREFALVGAPIAKPGKSSSAPDFSYHSYLEDPARADRDRSGSIDAQEALAIALSLTLNNLGGGVGGGIAGLNIAWTTALSFLLSILAICVGYVLGDRFASRISATWTGWVAGLLIIGVGIYEYFF